jgi:choline-phosphate cytidylyltransferase
MVLILAEATQAAPRTRGSTTAGTSSDRIPAMPETTSHADDHPRTVITFGTFDVFHVGHLRVIERAAALGDRLVVGVSADALNLRKKGREPVFSQAERLAIVAALKPVDEVFVEESLELKREYIAQYAADVLVMGDDWAGRFDELGDACEVVYLPRTPAISTTALIEKISGTS